MPVVLIKGGKVIEIFRDVETVAKARKKYPHLAGKTLKVADHPPGTTFAGGVFTRPVVAPKPARVHPFEAAIRVLMRTAPPADQAEIEALLSGGNP